VKEYNINEIEWVSTPAEDWIDHTVLLEGVDGSQWFAHVREFPVGSRRVLGGVNDAGPFLYERRTETEFMYAALHRHNSDQSYSLVLVPFFETLSSTKRRALLPMTLKECV